MNTRITEWATEVRKHYGQGLEQYVRENYAGDYDIAYADFLQAYDITEIAPRLDGGAAPVRASSHIAGYREGR